VLARAEIRRRTSPTAPSGSELLMRSPNPFVAAVVHGNSMPIRCAIDGETCAVLQGTDRFRSLDTPGTWGTNDNDQPGHEPLEFLVTMADDPGADSGSRGRF